MNFEEKTKKLELLINELESGNVSLEDSISKYTDAMKLVKECDEQLQDIEKKVNKMVAENGEIKEFEVE